MAVIHPSQHHHLEPWLHVTRWVLIVVGVVAAVIGLVILVGGPEQSIGLGGEWSAQVGDIVPAWGWGLLLVGGAALITGLGFLVTGRGHETKENPRGDLVGHAIVFVLVNGFIWAQAFALGGNVGYAWWVTGPWAVGLAAHAMSTLRRHA